MAPQRRGGAAAAAGGSRGASGASSTERASSEGTRAATQLLDTAEERIEQLERAVSPKHAGEVHLAAGPSTELGEEANIWYYAYGSNINKRVFEGRRRIKPAESVPAVLPGWRLTFAQPGLPFSEPAFAAVEPAAAAAAPVGSSGTPPDCHGVAHRITPTQWRYVLETEGASGQGDDHGYAVVTAQAVSYGGQELEVQTLTVPPKIKARLQGRQAQPSLRYLTLIREGAEEHGLSPEYRAWLASLEHYQAVRLGQRCGAWLFGGVAFVSIFPVWGALRLVRRATGMQSASDDRLARWTGRYTAAVFALVHRLHELLRPVLGCGVTTGGP